MKKDADLQYDVQQELRWDPSVHAAERIGVSVKNGVVELDGHVDTVWDKYAAERAALRVAKVKGRRVRNQSRSALFGNPNG